MSQEREQELTVAIEALLVEAAGILEEAAALASLSLPPNESAAQAQALEAAGASVVILARAAGLLGRRRLASGHALAI